MFQFDKVFLSEYYCERRDENIYLLKLFQNIIVFIICFMCLRVFNRNIILKVFYFHKSLLQIAVAICCNLYK